jgi:hypothetical protein
MGPGQREACTPSRSGEQRFLYSNLTLYPRPTVADRIVGPRLDTHFSLAFDGRTAVRRPLKMIDYLTLDWSDVILGVFMAQLLVLALFADIKGR